METSNESDTENPVNFETELADNPNETQNQMVINNVQIENSVNEMDNNAQASSEKVQAARSKQRIIYLPSSEADEKSDDKNDPDDIIDSDDDRISISESTISSLKFDDADDIEVIDTDSTISSLKFD